MIRLELAAFVAGGRELLLDSGELVENLVLFFFCVGHSSRELLSQVCDASGEGFLGGSTSVAHLLKMCTVRRLALIND